MAQVELGVSGPDAGGGATHLTSPVCSSPLTLTSLSCCPPLLPCCPAALVQAGGMPAHTCYAAHRVLHTPHGSMSAIASAQRVGSRSLPACMRSRAHSSTRGANSAWAPSTTAEQHLWEGTCRQRQQQQHLRRPRRGTRPQPSTLSIGLCASS